MEFNYHPAGHFLTKSVRHLLILLTILIVANPMVAVSPEANNVPDTPNSSGTTTLPLTFDFGPNRIGDNVYLHVLHNLGTFEETSERQLVPAQGEALMRGFLGSRMRLQLEADGFWSPPFEWEAGEDGADERVAPVVLQLYEAGRVTVPASAVEPTATGEIRLRVLRILEDSLSLPDWAAPPFDLPCEVEEGGFDCPVPAGVLDVALLAGEREVLRERRLQVRKGRGVFLGIRKIAADST